MIITYNDILSTLCKNNNFSTKLNIMKFSDEFEYFGDIFNDNFYRYGIYTYDDNYNNISFISSILYCLDEKNIL